MLQRNTVFVLGAGASVPYGFSTGGVLLGKAKQLVPDVIRNYTQDYVGLAAGQRLLDALVPSYDASIDALLEHRVDLVPDGKRLIAALLLQEEARAAATFPDPNLDWMAIVFNEMSRGAPGVDAVAANPVSFIT